MEGFGRHTSNVFFFGASAGHCPSAPFYELLGIYHDGDVGAYNEWQKKNGKTGVNANFDAKFNIIAFLSYAFKQPSPKVPINGLCTHLSLPQDSVESTIRSAIYQGFYNGKISHLGGDGEDYVFGTVTYDFGWKGEEDIPGIVEGLKAVMQRVESVKEGLVL
ncbi:hypothetical protein TrRE_jg12327 [Triparma retinervis]|uniref:Uncharacterized protein n=1 Tax=Triparma retinervis TaxID=2557542 RepID=A0A9W7A556_9STRA|nr:hypothetical protein TrRE_jg12327 [Triparma retinervis]